MREDFNHTQFINDNQDVDEKNLLEYMSKSSSILGYYCVQAAHWKSAVENMKLQQDVKFSEILLETKRADPKATQSVLEATCETHPDYINVCRALNKAKEQDKLFDAAVKTLTERAQNLRSMNANKRQELNSFSNGGIFGGSSESTGSIKMSEMARENLMKALSGGSKASK